MNFFRGLHPLIILTTEFLAALRSEPLSGHFVRSIARGRCTPRNRPLAVGTEWDCRRQWAPIARLQPEKSTGLLRPDSESIY